jgi:uncharacterized membrane protein
MAEQPVSQVDPNATDDDKLWAALAYVFTPVVPIIILFLEDKKDREFIKAHNVQALVGGVVLWILATVTFGCGSVIWFVFLYWAYKAYQGELVQIPLITDFVKNQGWA